MSELIEANRSIPTFAPRLGERAAHAMFHSLLKRIAVGQLEVIEPDGSINNYGDSESGVAARLEVHDASFYIDVLTQGNWGLGWSFVFRKWTSPSAFHVNLVLMLNESVFRRHVRFGGILSRKMREVQRWSSRYQSHTSNTREEAISVSYDVGNDFFRQMLGPSMVYTGGVWEEPNETLEQAQENKLRIVTEKAEIDAHHQVLDIGCGWGTLCGFIHQTTGAKVTGISLSDNQLEWAQQNAPGCEFQHIDYRDLKGRFDRIVSVGMAEHVGRENFPEYLAKVRDLLAPGGRFVLDTMLSYEGLLMASNQERWTSFASVTMPNADVPSMTDIASAAMKTGELRIIHTETFGVHYAKTCHEWQKNLEAARTQICRTYSDEVYRIYDYSWSLARAALEVGMSQTQVVLERVPYGSDLELGTTKAN